MSTAATQEIHIEGDGAWAAEQLAAGRAIRDKSWFRGSVHPHSDLGYEGQAFFRSGDPSLPAPEQDSHIGRWDIFLAKHPDTVWELATNPRTATAAAPTVIDLAFFPSALPVGMVMQMLQKHEEERDDFAQLIEWVWTRAGHTMVGKALAAFLTDEHLRTSIQLARQGQRAARAAVLEAILKLREGK